MTVRDGKVYRGTKYLGTVFQCRDTTFKGGPKYLRWFHNRMESGEKHDGFDTITEAIQDVQDRYEQVLKGSRATDTSA